MGARAETFVIVNYGAAHAREAWAEARRALADAGVAADAHEAREFGDARRSAGEALRAGYRTVAVVGGDGTLSEVASGFFEPQGASGVGFRPPRAVNPEASLALLPSGTGNDFARAAEGRRASLRHWLARLVAHCRDEGEATTRAVDVLHGSFAGADGGVGAAGEFLCLNAVTFGIGAEVAARVAAQGRAARRLSGEMRFALAALGALVGWRERRVRVRVDEAVPFELRTNLLAVVNSRFAGGGMMFSPGARIDDGLLDVVTAAGLTRAALLREMARVHSGGHLANPRVRILRGSTVTVEPAAEGDSLPAEADGDVRGHTPLTLRVLPRALRIVI